MFQSLVKPPLTHASLVRLFSVPTRQSLALWRPCRCQKVAWRQRHRQSRPTLGSPKVLKVCKMQFQNIRTSQTVRPSEHQNIRTSSISDISAAK